MSQPIPTWDEILVSLENKNDLSKAQIAWAMQKILSGAAENENIKRFLISLKEKGERPSEVTALVEEMFNHASLIEVADRCVDIVGTGGDGAQTINISTAAAIVTTAAGARTLKHGNRAATSKSGAADLLEALGININLNAAGVAECVRKIGIGFAFAPVFHPAMKHAAVARRELGVPTIFNILGPLANPAKPIAVAIGVARIELLELVAQVLASRGCQGFVFRGDDGLDEISLGAPTTVYVINEGGIRVEKFDPLNLGFELINAAQLKGGDAKENAAITREVFAGAKNAYREAILINAAAAIAAFKGDFDLGVEQQLANGYVFAKQAIDSGAAAQLVERWAVLSNELAKSSL
ncbi:MAG: anthranilate phosphoribosyltransferase [Candidatus Nanopelagicaceae bacterium]|nr:anthranilate phosphoribosyltransferase [Candidatus Nanopelagicaceae bacterium]